MNGNIQYSGMTQLIADNLYNLLEEERYKNQSYNYSIKIRFLEVVDEEVFDLLQPYGGHGFNKNNIKFSEWEGASV